MPVMVTQAKAGRVTALAVTSPKRSAVLPDVPTILEAGVNYEIAGWFDPRAHRHAGGHRQAPARRGRQGGGGAGRHRAARRPGHGPGRQPARRVAHLPSPSSRPIRRSSGTRTSSRSRKTGRWPSVPTSRLRYAGWRRRFRRMSSPRSPTTRSTAAAYAKPRPKPRRGCRSSPMCGTCSPNTTICSSRATTRTAPATSWRPRSRAC